MTVTNGYFGKWWWEEEYGAEVRPWNVARHEWVTKWGEQFDKEFCETVDFDHIQGKTSTPWWLYRWVDKLVFAWNWGWRPWQRTKKQQIYPDWYSTRLCHRPRGGSHRSRTWKSWVLCDTCGGPL